MIKSYQLSSNVLDWLLEAETPAVRYLTLRDLLDYPADSPELRATCVEAHQKGAIPAILAKMDGQGFWVKPGSGYSPKYYSTVWSIITLAQLGASADQDERIGRACHYLLNHALTAGGQFTTSGEASHNIDCLQGNLCAALLDLGYDDARLEGAFEWMARSVTGQGVAPAEDRHAAVHYYAYKCGPLFACGANGQLPCAWGAVKVMLAFSKLPAARRTPLINRAIHQGVDFLFSSDPADADYPTGDNNEPNDKWWKFGFPVFYATDLLQNVEALVRLGYQDDARLTRAIAIILSKQNDSGQWLLENDYYGKMWVDYGTKRKPSKWVTLRALQVLKMAKILVTA